MHIGRPVWDTPHLSVLGDVGMLTETGSMVGMESPADLCISTINMDFNSCVMG